MDPSQLTQILINATSSDQSLRSMSEKILGEADKQNPGLFLQVLCVELASEEKPPQTRTLAGLILKNALTAKDETRKVQLIQKWLSLESGIKSQIKAGISKTLASPQIEARRTAAQVIAKIAHIELPRNLWPDLIQNLLQNMQTNEDYLKQATLEALGYICEEIEADVLKLQANEILTAVCKGIKDPNNEIKVAGLASLNNALEFVKGNFEKEVERNYIMQVVCDSTVCPEVRVRVASLESLVRIADLYYDKIAPYMQRIFNITLEAIKKDEEPVALQAVEFWSTLCDEEIYLAEEAEEALEQKIQPSRQSQNFIRGAMKYLIPLLTETLTRQEDEPEEDTWNVAMAAGTCLSLVSMTVGDEVVGLVMPFVQNYINNPNWKFREAATLAFGAILEGPKGYLSQLITAAIPTLLEHMSDPIVYVKDTTAWTIGRVCQLHPSALSGCLPQVIQVLVSSLQDTPRVAANVCWAIHNIALAYEDDQQKPTSALSPFFSVLIEQLVRTTLREDSDESNLRTSAYEAINVIINSGAKDTYSTVNAVIPVFVEHFEKTFSMQIISQDDKENQNEIQSLLCGVLQIIIQKLGEGIKGWSDRMMSLFLQVFNSKNASLHEESLMAVGAIANAVESEFEKYMAAFKPFLIQGLSNYEEHTVCSVSVGVVGDISRAINIKILPYCDEIVTILLQDLQNPLLHRNVKPPILSCFGDIGMAIGGEFVKYLNVVMTMLQQASSTTTVNTSDSDLVEYINQLREGIFEAYTGIIQGLRSDNCADNFLPFVNQVLSFITFVFTDNTRTELVSKGGLGVIGDLAHALGPKVKQQLLQASVKNIISECLNSENQQTQEIAKWVKDTISKLN
jgi:importin subunit beta-1